ncbi:sugar phosphate isomerase/epimerase family protein [Sulfitobacter sp. D35]|uniref:sugar phosphate isomerase/epimerase family protein n=1 Tax=Sulfitobacter sp. D35 TaxID=3083252 RepID=UPI00296E5ADB|nr:sugar phosphate isomerase/epimerase family protein [Sulfitobacter sp. D35]MDW4498570.1 sugar phosphate isomerase/epimerase family protein [Sulfitobacter sp. D35]
MRLGLGSYAFRWNIGIGDQVPQTPMTAFDVLDAAERLGLEVVQYADNLPLHKLSEADLDRLRAAAEAKGITLELGTQSFDAEDVRRYLTIGRRIGSKLLRVALDAGDARMPVPELAKALRPLLDEARNADIRIAIENHFNYPSPRMVELLETVDDDALGVCLDVANSICAGEWPEETVRLLAPFTINLHLKDYLITPDRHGVGFYIHGVPLGEGRAPIPWLLDQLAHCPADMSVILEHWLPLDGDAEAARDQEGPWLEKTVAAAKGFVAGR